MSIRNWPRSERPREKLLSQGAESLSDAELLAVFIGAGSRGLSAIDIARDVLTRAGNLRGLLDLDPRELCRQRGIGPARAAELKACLEVGRRYLEARIQRGNALENPTDTKAFLTARLRGYPYEVFACLFLDNRHRIIRYEELFQGTIDGASVHPREVVRRALSHNAAAVIFSHNHPSGQAHPSQADRALTQRLRKALQLIDVRVLDHLVVGDGEVASFAEMGLM